MKNFVLVTVVLVSAVSISWALTKSDTPSAPEEESSPTEYVLQTYSAQDCAPFESEFPEFTSVGGALLVNIVSDKVVLRVGGTLAATSSTGTFDYIISYCGDCTAIIPSTPKNLQVPGIQMPGGCWDCTTSTMAPVDLSDLF